MPEGTPYASRLVDRVAVITGGGSGIGRAMCERFASEGASVAVVDLDEETGGAVAAAVGGMFVKADVTSSDEVEALYAEVAGRYGGIDICCNNAGISPPDDDSILDTGLDAWERVQRVNLTSVYLCCKHALPHLLARGKGSIINTASFVAVMGAATSQVSYTASKGGVLAMSRELGVQFARPGRAGQRAVPGAGEHAAFAGALRQGPRAGGPPPGAHPDGALRRGDGDRRRGGLPGLGRLVIHDRFHLPRRRRASRGPTSLRCRSALHASAGCRERHEPFGRDGRPAVFTCAIRAIGQSGLGPFELSQIGAPLAHQRGHSRSLEGDRRSLRIVFVVRVPDVRPRNDVVEFGGQRFDPRHRRLSLRIEEVLRAQLGHRRALGVGSEVMVDDVQQLSGALMSGCSAGSTRLLVVRRSSQIVLASLSSPIRCRVLARFSSELSVAGSSGPNVRFRTSTMRLRRSDDSGPCPIWSSVVARCELAYMRSRSRRHPAVRTCRRLLEEVT